LIAGYRFPLNHAAIAIVSLSIMFGSI
jgi:hypothetical protein